MGSLDRYHSLSREHRKAGAMGTPPPGFLYLLLDRQRELVVLHSEPGHGDYANTAVAKPGDPLALPKPFGFALDTTRLF
jgi:hypothetical protein